MLKMFHPNTKMLPPASIVHRDNLEPLVNFNPLSQKLNYIIKAQLENLVRGDTRELTDKQDYPAGMISFKTPKNRYFWYFFINL